MGLTASQLGDVCAVRCLTEGPNSDKPALEMCARSWASGCVFTQTRPLCGQQHLDDSPVLFRSSSHINESLGEIRTASR